jgi:hypothetical protein
LSTGLYKTYINELLLTLERNRVGTHIGTTYVGYPTVADDLALLANSTSDLQLMPDVTNSFANREKYVIHPEKSTIIMRIPKKSTRFEVSDWKLDDKEVSISQTTTHLTLDILRSTRNPYKLIRPYDRYALVDATLRKSDLISNGCSGLIIYLCGLRQIRPYIKWKRIIEK